jgi:hypothetical protein
MKPGEAPDQRPDQGLDDRLATTIERTWSHIASPGSFFTGPQRVDVASCARAKRHGFDRPNVNLSPAAIETVETIAVDAHAITSEWVRDRELAGISRFAYVELLAVTSFVVVLDTFELGIRALGIGGGLRTLPEPTPGDPTGIVDDNAKVEGGWVPTVGPAFPPTGFSAIPAEHRFMHTLHRELYISVPKMFDLDFVRDGLERDQLELVAARTSLLNDCFF